MEVPTMVKVRTWAALDVHVKQVRAAVFDVLSGELSERRLPGASDQVTEFISTLPRPARVVYEAGPTGFGLARELGALEGVDCMVCAPGLIPRGPTDRVKTDRLDRPHAIGWQARRNPLRGGAAVQQAGLALGPPAGQPLARRPLADPGGRGRRDQRPALLFDAADQKSAALRAGAGVTVDLHPVSSLIWVGRHPQPSRRPG
jgi:hypothetical protein